MDGIIIIIGFLAILIFMTTATIAIEINIGLKKINSGLKSIADAIKNKTEDQ